MNSLNGTSVKLRREKVQLEAIENMAEGVSVEDAQGTIVYVNRALERMFGYNALELIGENVSIFYDQSQSCTSIERLHQDRTGKEIWSGRLLNKRKNGTEFITSARLTPLKSLGQNFFVCVQEDITEQVKVEQALLESEARFRLLADAIPQMVFVLTRDGAIEYANKNWRKHFSTKPIAINWLTIVAKEDYNAVAEEWRRCVQSREEFKIECRLMDLEGVGRWHTILGRPMDSRWFIACSDIEESKKFQASLEEKVRKRTEEIRQSEAFLDSVIENIPNMLFVKDAKELRFIRFNRAGEDLLGYSRQDLLGKNDYDFFPKEQADSFTEKDREVLANKNLEDIPEEIIDTKARGRRILHTRKIPILGPTGEPEYLLGISEDVTERKIMLDQKIRLVEESAAREVAERATERMGILSEVSQILSSSLDFQTTIPQLVRAMTPKFADWSSVHLLNEKDEFYLFAIANADNARVEQAWELTRKHPYSKQGSSGPVQVFKTGRTFWLEEIRDEDLKARANNSEHLAILRSLGIKSYICVPLKTQGRVTGTIAFATSESVRTFDREDVKLAEEIAARAATALENSRLYRESQKINNVKDEFLATLSHELRTPLNVILGHAEILRSELSRNGDPNIQKSIDAILRNSQLQTRMISDLLDVSAIITGKMQFEPTVISPVEFVRSAVEGARKLAEAKSIEVDLKIRDREIAAIWADPMRLNQILWNLLSNAIKFTPEQGLIQVRLYACEGMCCIVLQDSGIGMKPEFIPRAFDRFRQEDSASSRKFGGLGLGLAIVKHLVDLHHGTITAESEGSGMGSRFTVRLPVVSEVPAPSHESKSEKNLDDVDLKGVHVLLVEDSEDNRDLLSRLLGRIGMRVSAVESAAEARTFLEQTQPDVILSDIGMAEEDGLTFMRKLRESSQGESFIPAIALTAYVRPNEVEEALQAGFQAHVGKPVSSTKLIYILREVLKNRQKI